MSLSQVGSGATYDNAGSSWATTNLTKDTGVATGDLIVIAASYYENGSSDFADPAGFTLRLETAAEGTIGSGTASKLHVWTRVVDGTEGASFTVALSGGGAIFGTAVMATFRGTSALTFASITDGTPANGTSIAAPSVSGTAGQALLSIYALTDVGGTYTPPSGMTLGIADASESTNLARIYYETLASSGATGTRTLGFTNTVDAIGVSMLVNGAGAGGGSSILRQMMMQH